MPIDVTQAGKDFVEGARAKSAKLVRNYTAKTGKIAAATSAEAQKNFEDAMKDPLVLKLRVKRLKELTDADLNARMEAVGAAHFEEGVGAAETKYTSHVDPYAKELDRILPTLKAKTRDARSNVANRVTPLAVGLQNYKKKVVGV